MRPNFRKWGVFIICRAFVPGRCFEKAKKHSVYLFYSINHYVPSDPRDIIRAAEVLTSAVANTFSARKKLLGNFSVKEQIVIALVFSQNVQY